MALPSPDDVKALPFGGPLTAAFAAVADTKIQRLIDNVAAWFGSPEVKRHTQRDEAVLYGAAHLLYRALAAEGLVPGAPPGGGVGVVTGYKLDGAGTINLAVTALTPAQVNDWLTQWSPFSEKLHGILDTFPPSFAVATGWPCDGPPVEC